MTCCHLLNHRVTAFFEVPDWIHLKKDRDCFPRDLWEKVYPVRLSCSSCVWFVGHIVLIAARSLSYSTAIPLFPQTHPSSILKATVYGALDKWIAWGTEFPLIAAAKRILRKRNQWKRVIRVVSLTQCVVKKT